MQEEKDKITDFVPEQEPLKEVKSDKRQKKEPKEIGELKAQIEELTKFKDDEHALLLRTAAEYDNYRRRTADEMTRKFSDGKAEAVAKLISVTDSIKLALAAEHSDDDPMYKGLCLIAKQFADSLAALGVSEIPTNIPFDPTIHNAVMHIDDDAYSEQEIVEVFAAGYKMGDRVIRHSMVRVAN